MLARERRSEFVQGLSDLHCSLFGLIVDVCVSGQDEDGEPGLGSELLRMFTSARRQSKDPSQWDCWLKMRNSVHVAIETSTVVQGCWHNRLLSNEFGRMGAGDAAEGVVSGEA
jgi:hypothetical protein